MATSSLATKSTKFSDNFFKIAVHNQLEFTSNNKCMFIMDINAALHISAV